MAAHDAEYFRARRRAAGVPERDPFTNPRFVQRGQEMAAMMLEPLPSLPWPHSLFCDTVKLSLSDSPVPKYGPDPLKCHNPICPRRHNNAVSRTVGSSGHYRVLWYCTQKCKGMHLTGKSP